jgi:ComF family protein
MGLLDLLYVPGCAACDEPTGRASVGAFCAACAEAVEALGAACPRCAEPFEGAPVAAEPLCMRCRRAPPPVEATLAPFRFGGQLAVALRRLKLSRRRDVARALRVELAPLVAAVAPHVDLAVPVPLHWRRMSSRGFNQSELLLRLARRGTTLTIDRHSLRRTRATPPQRGLSADQRAANVAGAFAVPARRRHRLDGARVLLFDDVVTTGATLFSAAAALRAAGAAEVIGLCVARAEAA